MFPALRCFFLPQIKAVAHMGVIFHLSKKLQGHQCIISLLLCQFPVLTKWLVFKPTHLKNMLVKLDHFPNFRGENSENIWNHLWTVWRVCFRVQPCRTSVSVFPWMSRMILQLEVTFTTTLWEWSRGHLSIPKRARKRRIARETWFYWNNTFNFLKVYMFCFLFLFHVCPSLWENAVSG